MNKTVKSYMYIVISLWICWIAATIYFSLNEVGVKNIINGSIDGILILILVLTDRIFLLGYLKENHYKQWSKITENGKRNDLKALYFLFSKNYLNDKNLKSIIKICRWAFVLKISILFVFIIRP